MTEQMMGFCPTCIGPYSYEDFLPACNFPATTTRSHADEDDGTDNDNDDDDDDVVLNNNATSPTTTITSMRKKWMTNSMGRTGSVATDTKIHDRNSSSATNTTPTTKSRARNLLDKTTALEENASEYASTAAEIRAKLEEQNKGLNFLNPFL